MMSMNGLFRRFSAFFLAAVMLISLLPIGVFAEETVDGTDDTPTHVQCTLDAQCAYDNGHSGNCSTFVQCDAEGCEYALNHGGNHSNFVQCDADGCEYALNHGGNHSNFVKCTKKEQCTLAEGHGDACNAPAEDNKGEDGENDANGETPSQLEAVQALINALPETVTADTKAAVEAQLTAIDTAKASLTDEETAQLDLTRWNAVLAAMDTLNGQGGASDPEAADPVTGTITQGCMSTVTDARVRLTGELTVSHTGSKLVIKLYSGETEIATSTLVNAAYINEENQTLSWNFALSGEESSSWKTEWKDINPVISNVPTKVALYIDDAFVAENTVTMNANNDQAGTWYEWGKLKGVRVAQDSAGNYYGSLAEAINRANGAEITLLGDVTENIDTNKAFNLNLNGKTVTGYFFLTGTAAISNGAIDSQASGKSAIESSKNAEVTVTGLNIVSRRHAIRVDGGKLIVNSGAYTTVGNVSAADTCHAINAGAGDYGYAKVTIYNGTFNGLGAVESVETADSGAAIAAQNGATYTIYGGQFNGRYRETVANNYGGTYTLYGGTYDQDPRVAGVILGDKKAVKKVSDTQFTVVEGTVKNETTGKYYASMQDAIDAAAAGDKIVPLADVTENNITVAAGKNVVIDLNGKTVTGSFMVYGTAAIQNGTINNTDGTVSAIENNGTDSVLTVEDVDITSARHAIRVDGGKATITGGTHVGGHHGFNISSGAEAIINVTSVAGTVKGAAVNSYGENTSVTINGGKMLGDYDPNYGQIAIMGGTGTITYAECVTVAADVAITINGGQFGAVKKMTGRGVAGGTYDTDPSQFVVQGKAAKLENGKYTIVDAVAEIGVQGYASIQDALAAAVNNSEIKILTDIALGENDVMNLGDGEDAKTITLNLDGNKLTGKMVIANEQSVLKVDGAGEDTEITLTTNAQKAGHTAGWKNGSTAMASNVAAQDGEYTINWLPEIYSITYVLNGGTEGNNAPKTHTFGTETSLVAAEKKGYTFAGWFANEDLSGTALDALAADGYTEDITLYAKWQANKYNIVYNVNGGTGSDVTSEVSYDQTVKIPGKPETFTGPTGAPNFVCWNTKADGSGTTYYPGYPVSNLATGEQDDATVTLYAVWSAKPIPTFEITKDTFTYNGKVQGIQFTANVPTDAITINYALATKSRATVTGENPINAGTYNVTINIAETNSTAAFGMTTTLTISKAELTATYAGETIIAGTTPALKVTVTGFVEGENAGNAAGYVAPKIENAPSTLGKHTLYPTGGAADNYSFTYVGGVLTIREKIVYVYQPDKLLQTGEMAWIIPVLAFCGVAIMAAGAWITLRKKNYGR